MDLTHDTFIYFALFVVPGFLAHRVFSAFVATKSPGDDKTFVLTAATLGATMFAVTLPVATWLRGVFEQTPHGTALALFLSLAAWPALGGAAAGWTVRSRWFQAALQRLRVQSPLASAWDHYFSKNEPCFVRVTMDDGTMIGGLWFKDGFASAGSDSRDLYLDEQWDLEPGTGAFLRPKDMTKGCWIDVSRARHLEFYRIEEDHEQVASHDHEAGEGRVQAKAD